METIESLIDAEEREPPSNEKIEELYTSVGIELHELLGMFGDLWWTIDGKLTPAGMIAEGILGGIRGLLYKTEPPSQ